MMRDPGRNCLTVAAREPTPPRRDRCHTEYHRTFEHLQLAPAALWHEVGRQQRRGHARVVKWPNRPRDHEIIRQLAAVAQGTVDYCANV